MIVEDAPPNPPPTRPHVKAFADKLMRGEGGDLVLDAPPPPPPMVDMADVGEPPRAHYLVETIDGGRVQLTGPNVGVLDRQSARKLADAILEAAGDAFLRPNEIVEKTAGAVSFRGTQYDKRWGQT